ncbi:muropeptide transporter [Posidoniimonas polymericola]|uniref:Muropeptide transporter n=1 Tax=Posidoniimonas polymericola TaxID=2528002 RepID=A0A5C5YL99_9BACT|nr:MFS transporter [Posidoniimonas polymericola]TWT75713.1 muropeptide transporter [Posidoniimonas polymericola]
MKLILSENPALRLSTLCVLYAAQGIPDGFVRIALKTHMISEGVSTQSIGAVIQMVSWPWALKWIWGPFIDRYGYLPMGRRRPWILAAQMGMALALCSMLFVPDLTASIGMIAAMVLLVNIFASLQDVSVDALAIDLLPPEERGMANGFMYGSSYAGTFIGGAVLGWCILHYGFSTAIATQVTLLLLIATAPFLCRERRGDLLVPGPADHHHSRSEDVAHPSSLRQLFGMLIRAFSLRSTVLAAALAIGSLVTVNSHLVFWPVHLQRELGWSSGQWLNLEGNLAVWCGLGGSLAGGLVASVFGPKRTVVLSLGCMAACWLAYYFVADHWTNHSLLTGLFLAESTAAAFLQVSMFALFMGLCWSPIAATQFTAYMAMLNLSNGLGARFAGSIEGAFAMPINHLVLAAIQLALIAVVLGINPNQVVETLGSNPDSETPARPSPGPIEV